MKRKRRTPAAAAAWASRRVAATFTTRYCSRLSLPPSSRWCTRAARWMTWVTPARAWFQSVDRSRSPVSIGSMRADPRHAVGTWAKRRTAARTEMPRASRRTHTARPTKPVAPVTRARTIIRGLPELVDGNPGADAAHAREIVELDETLAFRRSRHRIEAKALHAASGRRQWIEKLAIERFDPLEALVARIHGEADDTPLRGEGALDTGLGIVEPGTRVMDKLGRVGAAQDRAGAKQKDHNAHDRDQPGTQERARALHRPSICHVQCTSETALISR